MLRLMVVAAAFVPGRAWHIARRVPASRMRATRAADELASLTVPVLKQRLRDAGLSVSGRKAELVDRLASGGAAPPATTAAPPSTTAARVDDGATRPGATYSILHADSAIVVVDKGAGLLTVPGRGAHKADCLVARLRAEHALDVGCPHRLDRDTSGLLVLARTPAALRALGMAFEARAVRKVYSARALGGGGGEEERGVVDAPIGKLALPPGVDAASFCGPRMGVDAVRGRASVTRWQVRERRSDGTLLLRLEPVTGRAQQLRIHCAHVGMPLLGDTLHGTPEAAAAASRLCLHASELAFAHPEHGGEVTFTRDEEFRSEGMPRS